MRQTPKRDATMFILFIVISGIFIWYKINLMDKAYVAMNNEYPIIGFQDAVFDSVDRIISTPIKEMKEYPHSAYIIFNGGRKRGLFTRRELINNITLDSVLAIGDIIRKRAFSDTVYVSKRNDHKIIYRFVITTTNGGEVKHPPLGNREK